MYYYSRAMDDIIRQMQVLGFSPQEAKVYLSLLRGGRRTGYQIAKDLGLNRSGVYGTLQALYNRGAVYLVPGETREYQARDPEDLIGEIRKTFDAAAEDASQRLKSFSGAAENELFFNIRGKDQLMIKIRELIADSSREILINSDIPVAEFEPELSLACRRGVKVIMFSFYPQDVGDIPITFIQAGTRPDAANPRCGGNSRIMLTADMKRCILGGLSQGDFTATFSSNPLLISVIAEHIHIDSYLLSMRTQAGMDRIPNKMLMGTLLEKENEV